MRKVYEEMKRSLEQMQRIADSFEKELEILPQGSLSMRQQNKNRYYYRNVWSNGKRHKTYLNLTKKRNRLLLKKLQRRRFIEECLPILKSDLQVLKRAVGAFTPYDPAQVLAGLAPAYQDICPDPDLWLPAEPDIKRWAKEPYPRYEGYPEGLIHETSTGLLVRSKSESMIADALTLYGIPFRYEQLLSADEKTFAPDFTLLHPVTHRLIYWEHLGMMDDPDYLLANGRKIMAYEKAGMIAGVNLILTFEEKDHPLTMRAVQDIITLRLL